MDPATGSGPGDMEVEEGAGVAQFDFESESGEGVEEQLAASAPPALHQAAAAAPRPTPLMTTLPEAARLAVHSRNTSCVLRIAPEERRGTASQTETACARLAAEHRVKIERSTNKDQWLTLIISGKAEDVAAAMRGAAQQLQKRAEAVLQVAREYQRRLLRRSGDASSSAGATRAGLGRTRLQEIEALTNTRIQLPPAATERTDVRVSGPRDGVERARIELERFVQLQSRLAEETLDCVERAYVPFVRGASDENVLAWQHKYAHLSGPAALLVRFFVPPAPNAPCRIFLAGDRAAVTDVRAAILRIYEEKKRCTTTVSIDVPHAQHRYIAGARGAALQRILAETGVSVELPPFADEHNSSVTLRGEPAHIGAALTQVYTLAHSQIKRELHVRAWLVRHLLGPRGASGFAGELQQAHPSVSVRHVPSGVHEAGAAQLDAASAAQQTALVEVEGPPEHVEPVARALEQRLAQLERSHALHALHIEQRFVKHIVGRSGANVQRIRSETGCNISISEEPVASAPPAAGKKGGEQKASQQPAPAAAAQQLCQVLVDGPRDGVQRAVEQLQVLVKRLENEATRDLTIEARLHRLIIGANGAGIRVLSQKFPNVTITFPEVGSRSDIVNLRGPKDEVNDCSKQLQKLATDFAENNHQVSVKVPLDFVPYLIGREGATIRKIREETDTRINVPMHSSDSSASSSSSSADAVTVVGKRKNVEDARSRIEALLKQFTNMKEVKVAIPQAVHQQLIGRNGRLIRAICAECNNVSVHFPPHDVKSDDVVIRGAPKDIESAKKQLLELAKEKQENSFTAELHADPKYHRFLIGRGGFRARDLRERLGVRLLFPEPPPAAAPSNEAAGTAAHDETVQLVGKQENVLKAREELEALVKNLENIIEVCVDVPAKYTERFHANGGALLNELYQEFVELRIVMPRAAPAAAGDSSPVSANLRGPKECVEQCRQRILQLVSEWETEVNHECMIPEAIQVFLRKPRNMARLQSIKQKYHVQIHLTVPRRPIRRPARPVQKATPPANVNEVADDSSHQPTSASALELSSSAALPTGAPPGICTSEYDPTIGTLTNGSGELNHSGAGDAEHPIDEATASSSPAPAPDASAQAPEAEANHSSTSCVPSSEGPSTPGAVEEATAGAGAADAAPAAVTEEASQAQTREPEQDVVRIVGQPDCVHKAEEELRALLPVVVRVPVPAEFQSQIFAARGGPQFWRQLEHSHDIVVHPVVISGAPSEGSALHAAITDDSDVTQFAILRGVREDIDAATKEIEARVAECVKQKEDMIARNYTTTIQVKREYVPSLIGKSGSKVAELRDKFKVRISFPRRQPHQPQQPRAQPAAGDASAKPQETASRQQQQQQQQQAATDTQDTSDLPANTTTSSVPLTNGHSEHTTAEAPAAAEAVPTPAANENEKPVAEEEKPAETVQPSAEESTEKPVEANAAPSTISWAEEMERTVEEQLEEVVIVGYKDRADACRAEIERLVALAAAHTTEELFIDGSIHRRLIGPKGQNVMELRKQYDVQISFYGNTISVSGLRDKVQACCNAIASEAEQYMQEMEYSLRKPGAMNFRNFLPPQGSSATGEHLANGAAGDAPGAGSGRQHYPGGARGGHSKPKLDNEEDFPPIWVSSTASAPSLTLTNKWAAGSAKLKGGRAGGKRVQLPPEDAAATEPPTVANSSSGALDDVTIATGSYTAANGSAGAHAAQSPVVATIAEEKESASSTPSEQ